MDNTLIADAFEEMAELLELQGENPFRVRAYRNGAKAIRELDESIAEIVADGLRDLKDVPGIGQTLADKAKALVETGKLPQLEKLRSETPPILHRLTRIPGMGVKKALVLHRELGINSLDELRKACEEHRVRDLKGFGAKTEASILAGLSIAEAASQRLRIDQVERLEHRLREHLSKLPAIKRLEFAGSYRRGKDTIGDLDMLVISDDPNSVMDRLASFGGLVSITARGDTKMSIRVDDQFQVDLRVVPAESFGAALQYFTGSKEHNVAVRSLARKQGLTLNEYGVAKLETPDVYIAGASEEDVYGALGLNWIAPELREGRKEISWATQAGGAFPQIVEQSHITCDLHMHTHASDGLFSIEEMAMAARARGLKFIAITDHSQRVSMARGLNPQRVLMQWEEIDRINAQATDGFRILKGIECDILESGPMDLPDEVLAQADWVLGSVHYGQKQPREQITQRVLGALANPHVDAIAHPTGRLLGQRPPYDIDLGAVIDSAVQHGKALELNANPMRLDLSELHLIAAAGASVPITINTDAHSIDGMDVMRYGIIQARRAGLLREQVLNTWSLERLLKWTQRSP
ncbi:MAG: DNA polymerase/3'-5' exonuclease PolX [Pirellulaceae bacterium]|nr:DNA polymerase/3'-5' exonuclease PolX [Pirellulaceae bacterium]